MIEAPTRMEPLVTRCKATPEWEVSAESHPAGIISIDLYAGGCTPAGRNAGGGRPLHALPSRPRHNRAI